MLAVDGPPATDAIDPDREVVLHAVILCGFAVIGIGVFLPWVGETQLKVYVLGMASGFERQWGKRLVLGAILGTVLALVSLGSRGRWSVVGPVFSAIGVVTVLVAVYTTPLTGRWSPEIGVYVTLVGGLLVAGAPLLPVVGRHSRRP